MNIDVICVGKLKEAFWRDAVKEYEKRLRRFCTFNIVELKESRLPVNASEADENAVKVSEGESILKVLKENTYVVALDIKGKALNSEELADTIKALMTDGISSFSFLIGGSLGLSDGVLERADLRLSFSKMTFPHQLMRVILSEQLYRSFKIMRNEAYHK